MEKLEMVERLISKTNISYEDAKNALDKSNWDMLDAVVYLEKNKIIKGPFVSIYSTNSEKKYEKKQVEETVNTFKENRKENKSESAFESFFEGACKIIDKGNNIFLEVKKKDKILIKLPITVLVVLLIFAFWIMIPIFIIGLFIEIEFSIYGNNINDDKINSVLKYLSDEIKKLKENYKKGHMNG